VGLVAGWRGGHTVGFGNGGFGGCHLEKGVGRGRFSVVATESGSDCWALVIGKEVFVVKDMSEQSLIAIPVADR